MNMKKSLLLTVDIGALAAQQVFGLTVNVTRTAGYFTPGGGEFTITSVSPDPDFDHIYQNYAAVATLNGGFQTFCISETTSLQPNPQSAVLDPSGVTVGTAWLYSQFGHGTLPGYDYNPLANRAATAWELQNAIWALQGFTPEDAVAAQVYLNLVITQFGSLANAELANNGQFGVDALRLSYTTVDGASITAQPMLALVPDGGMTLMLLGMGLGTLGMVARRFRA